MTTFTHMFYLDNKDICLEVVCEMEYEPGGGDGWHEPKYEARVNLISAKVGECDITKALSDKDCEAIEQEAMQEQGAEQQERAAEADFERRYGAYD